MTEHHHDHHAHGHGHAGHAHADHGATRRPRRDAAEAAGASLLRASAVSRLGLASLAIAAVWGGVFWAMS